MLFKKIDKLLLIMKSGPQQNNENNLQNNEQIARRTFDQLQMLQINEVDQLLLFDQKLSNPLHQKRSQFIINYLFKIIKVFIL